MVKQQNKKRRLFGWQFFYAVILSMRPIQWTKNILVYFALFFTIGDVWDPTGNHDLISIILKPTWAFIIFSVLSSAVYLFNDILDRDKDRQHFKKRNRPIPSGALDHRIALVFSLLLALCGLIAAFFYNTSFAWICTGYLAVMFSYSVAFKKVVLLDVFVVSSGFVLRAVSGAIVLGVPVSPWLYVCTGLGALFICLCKRRSELSIYEKQAGKQRDTLDKYTKSVLDQFIGIVATATLLTYTLYTFTATNLPDNQSMMLTIPFVAYGIFRYIYLVYVKKLGENPEEILIKDVPIIVSLILWFATVTIVLISNQ